MKPPEKNKVDMAKQAKHEEFFLQGVFKHYGIAGYLDIYSKILKLIPRRFTSA